MAASEITRTSNVEWERPALPEGISTLGRLFETGRIHVRVSSRGRMNYRDYPGRALVLIGPGVNDAIYDDVKGFERPLIPGDVILVHPARRHRYGAEPGGAWAEFFISFDGAIFDALDADGVLGEAADPVFHAGDILPRLRRCLADEAGRPLPMIVAVGRLVALLTELAVIRDKASDKESAGESWILEARLMLEKEGVTVAEVAGALAATTGISVDALRKQFRRKTGVSMDDFRCAARVRIAMDLLEHTALPLKAVSHRLGFTNEQHFSRTISAATGFTPGAIRARRRFSPMGDE